jgi:hypothetical protein
MGVEEMDPEEKGTLSSFEPREHLIDCLFAQALDISGIRPLEILQIKLVVVEVEAII